MGCGCGKAVKAAGNAIKGAVKIVKSTAGIGLATPEETARRREICTACPEAVSCRKQPDKKCWCGPVWDGVWGKRPTCGCNLTHKTRLSREKCPLGKW